MVRVLGNLVYVITVSLNLISRGTRVIVVTVTHSLPDMSHFISEVIRKPLCQGSRRHKRWHVRGPSVTHDVLCYIKELFLISSANSKLFQIIFAFRSEQQAVEGHTFCPVCLPILPTQFATKFSQVDVGYISHVGVYR